MKLSDYKTVYEEASGLVSDIARQMSLAGIAIIWIFRQTEQSDKLICQELLLPLMFFILALTLDISQYIYKTIAWYFFFRKNERKFGVKNDPELSANPMINKPTWFLFWSKVIFLIGGYVLVFVFLIDKVVT